MTVVLPGRMKEICEEHEKVLEAFRKRDPDLVEAKVREYYRSTLRRMTDYVYNKRKINDR